MKQKGKNAHVHAEIDFYARMDMPILAFEHINADCTMIGDARKMDFVIVYQLLQQGSIYVNMLLEFVLTGNKVVAVCSICGSMENGVA